MKHPDYNSPAELKQILDINGFSMQKKFGQNFLINSDARKKLIDTLEVDENTSVWEVGPGLGAMTCEILERNAKLTVFEIDRGFASLVSKYFEEYAKKEKFFLVEGDVLKTWKNHLEKTQIPDRFFGNLPYNIAATIIADTIENNVRFDRCVFTVQKEVAQRMTAKPGQSDYSSFSVLCQWAYDLQNVIDLSGGNFWPKPNVDSRAVLFTKKADFPSCENPSLFIRMQRALFSSRRKTVRNNLSQFLQNNELAVECLNLADIDIMKRAEVLTIEQLLKLSDIINQKTGKK
ncbi:MAG: 16S rRNA (adenine(1518)-N(6)/adenine(1519)-N(6))-dimethyltransferase RsmA [Spirochaetales bacterium]|nr:16S rRNA (adenine(1518)-N(6)/adenine(1519)-N(6))-dimethyltransferase RsmA [Spirochaetales bacterium]MDY5915751.1 16S rRNA (adenine(1518)-N(6)/adenine(1519)-N(6))-dimethyltransferase RsmA [Treponema sp.]